MGLGTAIDVLFIVDTMVHGEALIDGGFGWTASLLEWIGVADAQMGGPLTALAALAFLAIACMGIPGAIALLMAPWIAAAYLVTRRAPRSNAR